MKIDKPDMKLLRQMFIEYAKLTGRDQAFKALEIINLFHKHYMEKIEIILAIAGEMQKHFKEGS